MDDEVFRALADPTRRRLLDRLFAAPGPSLSRLLEGLSMSRQAVSKHLSILEAANLVVTRRAGREKLHFLNPVPIRAIHDRWIHKYAVVQVDALADLARGLEGNMANRPHIVYVAYIRTSPEKLWEAITEPAFTRRYFHATAIESDFKPGSPVTYRLGDGSAAVTGEVLASQPPRRLTYTWSARWDDGVAKDRPSRVTWEIEPTGPVCKLTVVHDEFEGESATYRQVSQGWPLLLSSLKTLLETGEPLPAPAA